MSKKRDVFWLLDNYMTSDDVAQKVKEYISSLTERIEKEKSDKKERWITVNEGF